MKYQTIHSLGSRCQNSDILKHYNYREFSGFFDFMNTLKVRNIKHILEDDFNEILKPENNFSLLCNQLTIDPETRLPLPTSMRTSNKFYDADHTDVHGAIFPHHDLNTEKDYNHFLKCKKRFKKLKNYKTLFNYAYNTWENNLSKDAMSMISDTLKHTHGFTNYRICFIGITIGNESSFRKVSTHDDYDNWELVINNSFTGGLFTKEIDNKNYISIIESYGIDDNRVTKEEIDKEDMKKISFESVTKFEEEVAKFFGAPYAIAVDSCTHGIELCLRYKKTQKITVPKRTYISVPFLANKLGIELEFINYKWQDYYNLGDNICDAAVLWEENSYVPNRMMNLSFQFQKHLSLGRGGMILCDNKEDAIALKKMSYDGRLPHIPWREQNIDTFGYHYYMTPETAQLGLDKLPEAIKENPRKWVVEDWPDLTKMDIFNK